MKKPLVLGFYRGMEIGEFENPRKNLKSMENSRQNPFTQSNSRIESYCYCYYYTLCVSLFNFPCCLFCSISNLTVTDPSGKRLLFVENRKSPRFSYRFTTSPSTVVFYSSFTTGIHTRGFRMLYLVLDDTQRKYWRNTNSQLVYF